jgi:hypothetical protein
MFRLLVAGGRSYYNYKLIDIELNRFLDDEDSLPDDIILVHGDAAGVDRIAAQWAKYNDIPTEAHPADWNKNGRAGGAIRNQEMILSGIDYGILFPGAAGTFNMKHQLQKAKIEFKEVLDPTYF